MDLNRDIADNLISSHYLSLTSPFTWHTPPGPYRATTCQEGIKLRITDILFWPNKGMEGLPGWVSSPMPGPPPRQHKHERQYTPSTHSIIPTRRIWNDDDGQMIFGDLEGLKFPDICLTGEEKHRKKTSPRKPVPTGDRTGGRCVTGAHATTCSTAVDLLIIKAENYKPSGVVWFGLWLWERTACSCKNIDLRISSEVVWTGLYDKFTR